MSAIASRFHDSGRCGRLLFYVGVRDESDPDLPDPAEIGCGSGAGIYVDYSSFAVDIELRFELGFSRCLSVQRKGLTLHLSGRHGDVSPEVTIFMRLTGPFTLS